MAPRRTYVQQKKVLLLEHKIHTGRRIAALSPDLLMGGGVPPFSLDRGSTPIQSQWEEGIPHSSHNGVPPEMTPVKTVPSLVLRTWAVINLKEEKLILLTVS